MIILLLIGFVLMILSVCFMCIVIIQKSPAERELEDEEQLRALAKQRTTDQRN